MAKEEIKETQRLEREKYLKAILSSKAQKRIIVAGPGTGKTFTFSEVLKLKKESNNIAMT
jgi:predicted NACHT family NTPase